MSKRFQFLFEHSTPYIHGQFLGYSTRLPTRKLVDPRTRKEICEYQETTMSMLDAALMSSHSVNEEWSDARYRRDCLLKLADCIGKHDSDIAQVESQQTGKSWADALDEVTDVVDCFRHFAGYSDKPQGTVLSVSAWTIREPIGVVGLITSFNYPLMLAGWKLGPALAAGNRAILRPAPQTPLTALALAELSKGILPAGVLNVLPGGDVKVSQGLADKSDMTSFTGSTRVGLELMRRNPMKPITLECGGKNAIIVCEDADVELAVSHIRAGAFSNAGQNCCAVSRVLVHESLHEILLKRLEDSVGECGPLIDHNHYTRVVETMQNYPEKPVIVGKEIKGGYFVPPTVYAHVEDDSQLANEEIFGPVLCILKPFQTLEEAIKRVNRSKYGLAAGVFSQDYKKTMIAVKALEVGTIWINTYNTTNNALPFGGTKLSGFGKELGKSALDSYTFEKTVMIGHE